MIHEQGRPAYTSPVTTSRPVRFAFDSTSGTRGELTGDKAAREAFLNLVFAHEVAHFAPDYVHDPDDGRDTGPVVDAVNEIQQARGLLLRVSLLCLRKGQQRRVYFRGVW